MGEGLVEPLPWIFAVFQYFGEILPLVESFDVLYKMRYASNLKAKQKNSKIPWQIFGFPASMDRAVRTTMDAFAEWESKTCIRFVKRTTEKEYLWFHRGQR